MEKSKVTLEKRRCRYGRTKAGTCRKKPKRK